MSRPAGSTSPFTTVVPSLTPTRAGRARLSPEYSYVENALPPGAVVSPGQRGASVLIPTSTWSNPFDDARYATNPLVAESSNGPPSGPACTVGGTNGPTSTNDPSACRTYKLPAFVDCRRVLMAQRDSPDSTS